MADYESTDNNEQLSPYLRAVAEAWGRMMEGGFPGMPAVISELDRQQLGRGIAMWGIEDGDREKELIGYCLPLDEQNTQHVVAFASGTICQVAAVGDSIAQREYQKKFSSNERPLVVDADDRQDAERKYLSSFAKQFAPAFMRSDNPFHADIIADSFPRAWETAYRLKAERDAAKRRTAQQFVRLFGTKLELIFLDPWVEEQ